MEKRREKEKTEINVQKKKLGKLHEKRILKRNNAKAANFSLYIYL